MLPLHPVPRYGGFQACQFCAISSLAMQLEYDQTANIYTYAKLYHNKRPGIWTSYDDIRQIYRILSYMPKDLGLLKCTELRTEFDDAAMMTATPDLYSKICSNGSINNQLTGGTPDGVGNGTTTTTTTTTTSINAPPGMTIPFVVAGTPNSVCPPMIGIGGTTPPPPATLQNGGTVIVKMNGDDNDELSVVVATGNHHLNLDHNQT